MDTARPTIIPFRVGISDAEIVAHAGWQAALSRVLALLDAGTGRIAVLGLPGTGKSLLLRHLAATVPPTTALFLDEADRLDAAELAALPEATSCILAGRPDLADRLAQLRPPATLVWLAPLSSEEVARFVATRLAAAGQPRDLMSGHAIRALARHSSGIPRLINILAGAALFAASSEGATQVTANHVNEAVSFAERSAPSRRRPVFTWCAATLVLIAGVWALIPRPPHPAKPPGLQAPPPASLPASPQQPAPVINSPTAHSRTHAPVDPERHTARVVIHTRPGTTAEAYAMTAFLQASFGAAEIRLVPATPHKQPSIRYFYPADAPAARELATTLAQTGRPWLVQSFNSYRPLPRRGTLEIWIP